MLCNACAQGETLEPCAFEYRTAPELQSEAEEAAARWAAATGCYVAVTPTGDRSIELVSYLPRGDGKEAPAATSEGGYLIQVHERSPNRARSLLHEMGHSFNMTGHNSGHGVLSNDKDYLPVIDPQSLSDVCERIRCYAFVPEGDAIRIDSAAD